MDSEILSDRLSATESAVLQIDERVDDIEEARGEASEEESPEWESRVATLEAELQSCLARLTQQETEAAAREERILQLEQEELEILKALEAAMAEPEQTTEVEPEQTEEPPVEEVAAPSPTVQQEPPSPSLWERLFSGR